MATKENKSQSFTHGTEEKIGHIKNRTGGTPSIKQKKSTDVDADRNRAVPASKVKYLNTEERNLDLLVDGTPYLVNVIPFDFNGEERFYVRINDGEQHVFTWDSEIAGLRAIDDLSSILPDGVEEAISEKLQAH